MTVRDLRLEFEPCPDVPVEEVVAAVVAALNDKLEQARIFGRISRYDLRVVQQVSAVTPEFSGRGG